VELEHVCEQVRRALKPNGIFAFYEYVGEKRVQFSPLRRRLCEEALASVPEHFWRNQREVRSPDPGVISPFEAVRSDEIFDIVSARFDTVHWGEGAAIAAAAVWVVDLLRLGSESPEILDRFVEAEKRSMASGLGGCLAYGVFRPRANS
jgi:hypothetical protein